VRRGLDGEYEQAAIGDRSWGFHELNPRREVPNVDS